MKKKLIDVGLISFQKGYIPSYALLYLEAYLKSKNIHCELFFPEINNIPLKTLANHISEKKIPIVGIGGLYDDRFKTIELIKQLKTANKNIVIVTGGNMVSPIPAFMLEKLDADIVVVGEGEIIFSNLVEKILSNKDYTRIKGLVFKKNHQLHNTGQGPYIKNLDEIPALNFSKFPLDYFIPVEKFIKDLIPTKYFTKTTRLGVLYSGRGCPFRCNFCYHSNSEVRFFSIEKLIEQAIFLKNRYKVNLIRFADDLTIINKERTFAFCRKWLESKIRLPYLVTAHFNTLTEEIVEALKASGCIGVAVGLESGSQQILNRINKNITLDIIHKGLKLLSKHKLIFNGAVQVGQIKETYLDALKSFCFFYSHINEYGRIVSVISTPYPGTTLYSYALKNKLATHESIFQNFGNMKKVTVNLSSMHTKLLPLIRIFFNFMFSLKYSKSILKSWYKAVIYIFNKIIKKYIFRKL